MEPTTTQHATTTSHLDTLDGRHSEKVRRAAEFFSEWEDWRAEEMAAADDAIGPTGPPETAATLRLARASRGAG